ncbi:MAG: phage antirepressor N-terminal domain-containing protein [Candidatus Riflebacteria bacterium]
MPASQSLIPVSFHGDTIYVVNHQGEPFAPLRPIVENMGLDRKVQQRKLANNQSRWGGVIMTLPSASGLQKTLCIPVRKLAGFLATINPLKVRNELRAKIIRYQNECDDALWNYWTTGTAKRPESSTFQPIQPDLPLDDSKAYGQRLELEDLRATYELQSQKYIRLLENHLELLEGLAKEKIVPAARAKKRVCPPVTDEEVQLIRQLFRAGVTRYKIAKQLGRGRTTITKYTVGSNA